MTYTSPIVAYLYLMDNDISKENKTEMKNKLKLELQAKVKNYVVDNRAINKKICCNIQTKKYIDCIYELNLFSVQHIHQVYKNNNNLKDYIMAINSLTSSYYVNSILEQDYKQFLKWDKKPMYFHILDGATYDTKIKKYVIETLRAITEDFNENYVECVKDYCNEEHNSTCDCKRCANFPKTNNIDIQVIPQENTTSFYDIFDIKQSNQTTFIVAKISIHAIIFYTKDSDIGYYDLLKLAFDENPFVINQIKNNQDKLYYYVYTIEYFNANDMSFYEKDERIINHYNKTKPPEITDDDLLNLFDKPIVKTKKPKTKIIKKVEPAIPVAEIIIEPVILTNVEPIIETIIEPVVIPPVILTNIEPVFNDFKNFTLIFSKKSKFINKKNIIQLLQDYYTTSETFYLYLQQYNTITIIKDIHNSHLYWNILHFNLILSNFNTISKVFHANLKKNVITSITEINKL